METNTNEADCLWTSLARSTYLKHERKRTYELEANSQRRLAALAKACQEQKDHRHT
jgi:hypothetical protein